MRKVADPANISVASPEELVHTYLTQNEVLNNLDEGVVFVDAPGKIQLVNRAAEGMLGQRSELLEGAVLDSLIQEESGESLLREKEEKKKNISTSRPNILSCCIPLRKNERRSGSLLILSDRTEAMRTAEQLNGTRHIVSALRANSCFRWDGKKRRWLILEAFQRFRPR